jgi:type IV/VI secretion system ImpK/VasF family protein
MTMTAPNASQISQGRPKTLLDLSEPLFQYICRLNRSARKGGNYELSQVQSEIRGFLAEAKGKAVGANLAQQWNQTELLLMFFADFMIKESALPWAREWKELAFERHEMAGDEKFFDLLEETLKDQSPAANDRLAVFYVCMGLGFSGWYTGQPEYLRRKMKEIASRLQSSGQFAESQRICPDTYEKVDTRDLVEPPGTKLIGIAIALFGLILVLFVAYGFLYRDNSAKLMGATKTIISQSQDAVTDNGPKEVSK